MSKNIKADVVIIGGGIGGLLCSALLARYGYKVIVLEKLSFPGGRYTTLEREGYKINTGAWAVGLHGTNGPLWKLLVDLGVEIETRIPEPQHAHLWVMGKDIPLPKKGQFRTIIEAISKNRKESERVLNATRQALKWQEPSDEIMCDQWLFQYTDNVLIHGQFDFFSRAMTGTYYSDFPAGEYFRLLGSFGQCGSVTAMPKNGQKSTIDALLVHLDRGKVDLFLETEAVKVVCEQSKVKGVIATGGPRGQIEIDTDIVISDVGPKETVKLVGKDRFDAGYLREVEMVNETRAVVTIFGYDKPIVDYQSHIQFIELDRLSTAWEPCHIWPDYAPRGKQCLYTYSTIKTDDTAKELELIVEQCVSQFPALQRAQIIANLVYKGEWPILRAKPGHCLKFRTPIYGLYLAGDAVNVSGWTCGEGISLSCLRIEEDIKKRFPR